MILDNGSGTGARPTNDITIQFKIRPKFQVLWYKIYATNHSEIRPWTDHSEILHTSRQLHCRDVHKISLWSVDHISN